MILKPELNSMILFLQRIGGRLLICRFFAIMIVRLRRRLQHPVERVVEFSSSSEFLSMSDMDTFPEDEKRWFMHVGYLAQNWAAVEGTLDGMTRQLHGHYDGHLIAPEVPLAFSRKNKFIRKAFAAHPKLIKFSDRCQLLLDEAKRLADIRHWALHSGWVESDQKDALLRRYSKSEPLKLEDKRFSLDDIYQAAADCGRLTLNLSFFGQLAFGLKSQEEVDKLISELISKITSALPSGDPSS